jgi:flagellar P-ring protein FlgI
MRAPCRLPLLALAVAPVMLRPATRLKEVASLEGARDNQLIGYGLVVGLARTGDTIQALFPAQSLTNLLRRMGVTVNPASIQVRNTAAVMVTATLPPFAQPGTRIDATAAAVGDSTNLQGGLLLLTPLKGADGQDYAVAQGAVVTGGFVAGRGGNSQTVNHPTVGRVPDGAIVERAPPSVAPGPRFTLQLRRADFTTAARVADAINKHFGVSGVPVARAESAAAVTVATPPAYTARTVEFVAELESLTIEVDQRKKIVVNERTGTIVAGKDVHIAPVAVLQGALRVEIRTQLDVSQPAPLSQGKTTATADAAVDAKPDKANSVLLGAGATVEELVRALETIGSTPRDIIAILQSLREAGALDAELEVI